MSLYDKIQDMVKASGWFKKALRTSRHDINDAIKAALSDASNQMAARSMKYKPILSAEYYNPVLVKIGDKPFSVLCAHISPARNAGTYIVKGFSRNAKPQKVEIDQA